MAGELREQVLTASMALIAEAGLAGLSMREVARRAGVSHQAPYHHFPDKASIVAALVERGFTLLAERLEAAEASPGTVAQRLTRTGRAYVDFALQHPVFFQLMYRPELVGRSPLPRAEGAGRRALAVLERLVAARMQARGDPPALAPAMVSMHWAVAHGLASLLLDGPLGARLPDPALRAAHVEETLALFARSLP